MKTQKKIERQLHDLFWWLCQKQGLNYRRYEKSEPFPHEDNTIEIILYYFSYNFTGGDFNEIIKRKVEEET